MTNWGEAAILLALTCEQDDPKIILTKRAEHLRSHAGEVAFPGGKWEPGDNDLLMTALRETHEEIDLPPESVEGDCQFAGKSDPAQHASEFLRRAGVS